MTTTASATTKKEGWDDFFKSYTDEPHASRRKEILAKHPEIETLFGPDSSPAPVAAAMVIAELCMAIYCVNNCSFLVCFLCAWLIGGTLTHSLSLMTHELSHNLVFKEQKNNVYFGYFCNFGTCIPSCATFKRYHMEHHQFQGMDNVDVDIPTDFEGKIFRGILGKSFFVAWQSLFYSVRPAIVRPKSFNKDEAWNYAVVLAFDCALVYFFGINVLFFVVSSALMGMGFHPMAGHFISEHYVFQPGYETYSYYGILNKVAWNVGYHNEHHDFPRVPGWKLPQVKAMAPEYYDNLPVCKSWVGVLWNFIMDPKITLYSRMTRKDRLTNKKGE